MAKPDLISLQGEMLAALITNGVVGPYLTMGNAPNMQIAISSDSTDHFTAIDGTRAKDAILRKATGVTFSGSLEELNKQNKNILFSGETAKTTAQALADQSLGTVQAGHMISLGHRNLTGVAFKTGSTDIDPSTYSLDSVFGTVEFLVEPAGPVTWSGSAGVVERTAMATHFGREYALLFKGIDTYSGDKLSVELWRVQFSPDTEFDLINEDFASFDVEGECLADSSKANDPQAGPFGCIDRFSVA
ncbi:phage tail tube protein [Acinetobacter tandoii]|jgi:hypothetical protein|uniref:Uncharacterized protein n=1 Tax=Acinetobacter tandoii DSM 14970 = CIP 107469 TaxID=1120927 RepID=R9B1F8_9GAMM|nr:hypothetical protein [Acinetobacter tandoii]EOR08319.1 hypothetical protein I593_01675 [Acinetobacter tandoii DSM 14970 = CIP 107469]